MSLKKNTNAIKDKSLLKRMTVVVLYLVLSKSQIAQQFQFLYNINNYIDSGVSISKLEDGFLTTHLCLVAAPLQRYAVVTKFSNEGILQWSSIISSDSLDFHFPNRNINTLPGNNSEERWVIGLCRSSNVTDDAPFKPFLKKFSSDGNESPEVVLSELEEINLEPQGAIRKDNEMYILCEHNNSNDSQSSVIKCDSLGGFFSQFEINTENIVFQSKRIVNVEDGFLVGGTKNNGSNGNLKEQLTYKFDFNGQELWHSSFGFVGASAIGAANYLRLENGNYLFANTLTTSNYRRPFIGELDASTGDTLWTRFYFDVEGFDPNNPSSFNSYNELNNFKKSIDGGYIGVGTCQIDTLPDSPLAALEFASFIMKLDSEYNLQWKKVYIPEGYSEASGYGAFCSLNDFFESENGFITAVGYAHTFVLPQGPKTDSYFVSVDSLGCLVSGCTVGVNEFEPVQDIVVYPNPTTSVLTLESTFTGTWDVSLYDLRGSLILQKKSNLSPQNQIDLEYLPSGIYTLRCTQANQKHLTKKIVKIDR